MAVRTESRTGKDKPISPVPDVIPPSPSERTQHNGSAPSELHELLHALQAMRAGDFSVRMAADHEGLVGKIAETFNEIVSANQRMSKELERAGEIVGREGKTRHRVKFEFSSGAWGEM